MKSKIMLVLSFLLMVLTAGLYREKYKRQKETAQRAKADADEAVRLNEAYAEGEKEYHEKINSDVPDDIFTRQR